jgi:hypothetical protein
MSCVFEILSGNFSIELHMSVIIVKNLLRALFCAIAIPITVWVWTQILPTRLHWLKHRNQAAIRPHSTFQSKPLRQTPRYYYHPLHGNSIRLLVIHPAWWSTAISCEMRIFPVDSLPEYEALSYNWGCSTHSEEIEINGQRFPVTQNLRLALQHLRRKNEARILWVDAICINQMDFDEKSEQVGKMDKIYRQASNVCIWLGESSDDSDMAMSFLHKVLDLNLFDDLVRTANKETSKQWQAVISLMSRPWFSRRWIVQEIALASTATLHCGNKMIKWADFADAVDLVGADSTLNSLWEARTIPATHLVYAANNLCRKSSHNGETEKLRTLDVLLSTLTAFKVTYAADTIFALLALARDTTTDGEYSISVDYNKTTEEVCADFLNFSRHRSGFLDMICVPWAPIGNGSRYSDSAPSWLCPYSSSAFSNSDLVSSKDRPGRTNADSLVGMLHRKNYRASRDTLAKGGYINSEKCLEATGFIVDATSILGSVASDGDIPKEWLHIATLISERKAHDSGPPGSIPERFWRTLAGDRGPDGTSPPSWYGRACEFAFKHGWSYSVCTTQLIKAGSSSVVGQYLKRVQCVTWNRRFGTTEKGTVGIFPSNARVGDQICILFGCSVPVVLRPQGQVFQLVGECFVYGIMDGEALDRPHKEVNFNIK